MAIEPRQGRDVAVRLSRVFKLMHALKSSAPRAHEAVEQSMYPVLFVLAEGPRRITALAERTHTDASVVSRQVQHLERHGFVARTPDPDDRRACLVAPTTQGVELIDELMDGRGRWFARLLADWTPEQAADLDRGLDRLATSLEHELTALAGTPGDPHHTDQETP